MAGVQGPCVPQGAVAWAFHKWFSNLRIVMPWDRRADPCRSVVLESVIEIAPRHPAPVAEPGTTRHAPPCSRPPTAFSGPDCGSANDEGTKLVCSGGRRGGRRRIKGANWPRRSQRWFAEGREGPCEYSRSRAHPVPWIGRRWGRGPPSSRDNWPGPKFRSAVEIPRDHPGLVKKSPWLGAQCIRAVALGFRWPSALAWSRIFVQNARSRRSAKVLATMLCMTFPVRAGGKTNAYPRTIRELEHVPRFGKHIGSIRPGAARRPPFGVALGAACPTFGRGQWPPWPSGLCPFTQIADYCRPPGCRLSVRVRRCPRRQSEECPCRDKSGPSFFTESRDPLAGACRGGQGTEVVAYRSGRHLSFNSSLNQDE